MQTLGLNLICSIYVLIIKEASAIPFISYHPSSLKNWLALVNDYFCMNAVTLGANFFERYYAKLC